MLSFAVLVLAKWFLIFSVLIEVNFCNIDLMFQNFSLFVEAVDMYIFLYEMFEYK